MRKVMIIDDESQVLSALQRYLVRNNWRVISFNHPETALDYARYGFFPVVISDYRMPKMDGVDFLLQYQKVQPYSFKIMLSGQADQEGMTKAINLAEIDRFLHKPWDNQQLLQDMEAGLLHFQAMMKAELQHKRRHLSKEEYLLWYERLLERSSPGITDVRKNSLGWLELDQ